MSPPFGIVRHILFFWISGKKLEHSNPMFSIFIKENSLNSFCPQITYACVADTMSIYKKALYEECKSEL